MLHQKEGINKQVLRTRKWILEALLILLEHTPYEKIKIANITEKAGVARQTFYRNYNSKDEIIIKYLDDIFKEHLTTIKKIHDEDQTDAIYNYHFENLFRYLKEHRETLAKIIKAGLYYLLLEQLEKFVKDAVHKLYKEEYSKSMELYYRYSIKYQIGGISMIIMDWLVNDEPISPEHMGNLISEFGKPFREQGNYVPDLLYRFANQIEQKKS